VGNFRLLLNVQKPKVLQLQRGFAPCPSDKGALPLDPAGGSVPDPRYRPALSRSPWGRAPQILRATTATWGGQSVAKLYHIQKISRVLRILISLLNSTKREITSPILFYIPKKNFRQPAKRKEATRSLSLPCHDPVVLARQKWGLWRFPTLLGPRYTPVWVITHSLVHAVELALAISSALCLEWSDIVWGKGGKGLWQCVSSHDVSQGVATSTPRPQWHAERLQLP